MHTQILNVNRYFFLIPPLPPFHHLPSLVYFSCSDEGNQALQEFLLSKNPRQEHSSTLESYLIKPIQRILKYPLLLQQLKNLTDPYAEEHQHLIEALKGMEKVAEHINEMQRIHEEYGAIFDHLFRQHQKSCKQPIDLSPGRFSLKNPLSIAFSITF
jgi:hypothetical protein